MEISVKIIGIDSWMDYTAGVKGGVKRGLAVGVISGDGASGHMSLKLKQWGDTWRVDEPWALDGGPVIKQGEYIKFKFKDNE